MRRLFGWGKSRLAYNFRIPHPACNSLHSVTNPITPDQSVTLQTPGQAGRFLFYFTLGQRVTNYLDSLAWHLRNKVIEMQSDCPIPVVPQ